MSIQGINGTSGAQSNAAAQSQQSGQDNGMGQDAFLRLLTTQLAHQDPMEPVADTEFLAQLAQFSTLEQLTQINVQIQELSRLIAEQGGATQNASSTGTSSTTNGGQ